MSSMNDPMHTEGAASRSAPPADRQAANAAAMSATPGVTHQGADEERSC